MKGYSMKKAYIVGIAGGSGSGKSTFCGALEAALRPLSVKALHMDDYFREEDQRPRARGPVSGVEYMDDNHPLTMNLARLREDIKAARDQGDLQVLLVEGLLTLQDDGIFELLDLKFFVECPADERIVRRLRRNMEWGLSFDEISNVYLDLVRFRHNEYVEPSKWRADVILNGSKSSRRALAMVAQFIRAACAMQNNT